MSRHVEGPSGGTARRVAEHLDPRSEQLGVGAYPRTRSAVNHPSTA
jgi:hypothetical protein